MASNTRSVTPLGAAARKALAADSRVALLEALSEAGRPLDAAEAGGLVGLHRNTARVHLERLADAGLVERRGEDRSRPGRPKVLYTAAAGAAERPAADGYRALARALAAQLAATPDAGTQAVGAGRRWGAALARDSPHPAAVDAAAAIDRVTGAMDRLGFRPVADERRILLRHCPFADLARAERTVVCNVHLGMLEAAFDDLGAPVGVERLDPLVQSDPLLCVAHLRTRERNPHDHHP